jgi:hypothetical protein
MSFEAESNSKLTVIVPAYQLHFRFIDYQWQPICLKSKSDIFEHNTIADNNLEQIVDFPTRKDKILDLILTSHPSFKQRCKPMPSIGNSDNECLARRHHHPNTTTKTS